MGDRTFSAEDLIRIYEFYLTQEEQETVEIFFLPEIDINVTILTRILDLFLMLVSVLTSPLIGFLLSVLPAAIIQLHNDIVEELFRTNRALSSIIRRIDA